MNITDIENAIRDWIVTETSVETIFAYPNAPRPKTQYVLVNMLTTSREGTHETIGEIQPNFSTVNEYSSQKQVFVSINTYYTGAFQLAEEIINSLNKVTVYEDLYAKGLGYVVTSDIQKIDELIDENWEERAQFDITFNYRSSTTETIETIQKVELTNELDGTTSIIEKI